MTPGEANLIHSRGTLLALALLVGCGLALLTGCEEEDSATVEGLIVLGRAGRQPGQFSKPRAVAATADGNFHIIDRTGRVQVFRTRDGGFVRQWWLPEWVNGTPTGISIDPLNDTLWVADTHYMRVQQFTAEGELLFQFGEEGEAPGMFVFPTDVAPDPDGRTLWVCEYGRRNRIMQFTRAGEFVKEWGPELFDNADLQRPMAIAVSPDGNSLYVVDAGNNRINVYDREGGLRFRFGEAGAEPGKLRYPLDLAIAPDETLYIVEYGNSRVSRWSLEGEWLGCWGGPGHGDGEFFAPWGLAVAPTGELIVADTNNMRLQILTDPAKHFTREANPGSGAPSGTTQATEGEAGSEPEW